MPTRKILFPTLIPDGEYIGDIINAEKIVRPRSANGPRHMGRIELRIVSNKKTGDSIYHHWVPGWYAALDGYIRVAGLPDTQEGLDSLVHLIGQRRIIRVSHRMVGQQPYNTTSLKRPPDPPKKKK